MSDTAHTPRKEFLLESQGKIYRYTPFGSIYELEGEKVMDCHVHEDRGVVGYGPYCGQTPMTLKTIQNWDGGHV